MNPLIDDVPIIGGMSVFFLNKPVYNSVDWMHCFLFIINHDKNCKKNNG